jgi:hypothetical protein
MRPNVLPARRATILRYKCGAQSLMRDVRRPTDWCARMSAAEVSSASPFFIVRDARASMDFYTSKLGFEITHQQPAEDPFFGIVARGGAMIMLKSVGVLLLPNSDRSSMARWDAYFYVPDPDSLAAEFTSRNVEFSRRAAWI